VSIRTYYVDCSSHTPGDGSLSNQFTYAQLSNYFNPDLGESCGITPESGDVFNIINGISFVSSDTLFSIKRNLQGKITLKSPSSTSLPWTVDTVGNPSTSLNFLKSVNGYSISDLEIRDFIFCQNNEGNVFVDMVDLTSETLVEVVFKNAAIFTLKDVVLSTNDNITAKYFGVTFQIKSLYL